MTPNVFLALNFMVYITHKRTVTSTAGDSLLKLPQDSNKSKERLSCAEKKLCLAQVFQRNAGFKTLKNPLQMRKKCD